METFSGIFYVDFMAYIISVIAIVQVYFYYCFSYWSSKGVYTSPPSTPFGNARDLLLQKCFIGEEFKKVYNEFKQRGLKYGGYYIFGKPILVVNDLSIVKNILVRDFNYFIDHPMECDKEKQPLSAHLLAIKGEDWKIVRNQVNPAFSTGKIKMMFETVKDCTTGLSDLIENIMENEKMINIKDVTSRYTVDVVGSCGFGLKCNSLKDPNSDFYIYATKFFAGDLWDAVVRFLNFFSPGVLKCLGIKPMRQDIHDFFMSAVKETVRYREENNISRKDFVHLLIQLKNNVQIEEHEMGKIKNAASSSRNSAKSITVEEIAAHSFAFFIAGFETSSTTLSYLLYEVVKQPEIQRKLRKEVNDTLSRHGDDLTYDAVMEMSYMEMCINETLRKYPPANIHTRLCTKTYHVPNSDLIVEEGTIVFISTLGIHHDAEYYPDPDKFDPERFTQKHKASRPANAWIPFGDGPRMCPGLRFGLMEMKIALSILLKDFRFTLNSRTCEPFVMDPRNSLTPTVLGGIWLNAERISLSAYI